MAVRTYHESDLSQQAIMDEERLNLKVMESGRLTRRLSWLIQPEFQPTIVDAFFLTFVMQTAKGSRTRIQEDLYVEVARRGSIERFSS